MMEEFVSLWDIRDDQAQSNWTAAQSNRTAAQSNSRQSQSHKKQLTNKKIKPDISSTSSRTSSGASVKGVIYQRTLHEGGSPSVEEKEKSTEYPEFESFYRYDDGDTGAGTSYLLQIVFVFRIIPSFYTTYAHLSSSFLFLPERQQTDEDVVEYGEVGKIQSADNEEIEEGREEEKEEGTEEKDEEENGEEDDEEEDEAEAEEEEVLHKSGTTSTRARILSEALTKVSSRINTLYLLPLRYTVSIYYSLIPNPDFILLFSCEYTICLLLIYPLSLLSSSSLCTIVWHIFITAHEIVLTGVIVTILHHSHHHHHLQC